MAETFCSRNAQNFFSLLQKPFTNMVSYKQTVSEALLYITDELRISKVRTVWKSPTSVFNENSSQTEDILFYKGNYYICDEIVSEEYANGDGGSVYVEITKSRDAVWDEGDIIALKHICYLLYISGSSVITQNLITSAVTTNLLMKVPNETGFMAFLGETFGMGRISEYDAFYFNIKNFKYVNTVLPFSQEVDVLKEYVTILSRHLIPNEILAHLGSDNFCALIYKERSENFLSLIHDFSFAYNYDGIEYIFSFGATVGVAHLDPSFNPGKVMMSINAAYLSARQNKHSTEYFSQQLFSNMMLQKELFAKFKPAIDKEEFVIFYQPKVRVSDKVICGAEALVRWKQGDKVISPGQFIPVFEKDGSICELDFYVLEKVCKFIRYLLDSGLSPIKISTNFSRNHLHNPTLAKDIEHVVDKYHIPHKYLEIELTESEDFRDYVIMEKVVEDLRTIGISTSIDDFGTGYSSLNMLKRTQLDLIKIDKSFIPEDKIDPEKDKDFIMFKQIVYIAKSLGMETIAEGVETSSQYEYLKQVNCDIVQGFLFDKPLPEDEFVERLKKGAVALVIKNHKRNAPFLVVSEPHLSLISDKCG